MSLLVLWLGAGVGVARQGSQAREPQPRTSLGPGGQGGWGAGPGHRGYTNPGRSRVKSATRCDRMRPFSPPAFAEEHRPGLHCLQSDRPAPASLPALGSSGAGMGPGLELPRPGLSGSFSKRRLGVASFIWAVGAGGVCG